MSRGGNDPDVANIRPCPPWVCAYLCVVTYLKKKKKRITRKLISKFEFTCKILHLDNGANTDMEINKTPHAPLKMAPLPEGPWEEVSADFDQIFTTGEYLLVLVDGYSRYPEVEIIRSLSVKKVIPNFDKIFSRHGVPKIKTDNGPPFNEDVFTRWGKSIGFHHRKVTPLWPKSNGEAERMMDTLGKMIRVSHQEKISWKQTMYQFVKHYRTTPHLRT